MCYSADGCTIQEMLITVYKSNRIVTGVTYMKESTLSAFFGNCYTEALIRKKKAGKKPAF